MNNLIIKFLIDDPNNIFKNIIRFVTFENKNERQTRSSLENNYSCKYTQFILLCNCLFNDNELIYLINNYDHITKQKNQQQLNEILSCIGRKCNNVYSCISSSSAIKNSYVSYDKILKYNSEMLSNKILTNVECNYNIIPLCLYYNDVENEKNIIVHYFTIIINKINNTFYVNSSYGIDNFQLYNKTTVIKKNSLFKIMNLFNDSKINDLKKNKNMKKFVEKYFLCDVINENIIDEEILELMKCNIGYVIEYENLKL